MDNIFVTHKPPNYITLDQVPVNIALRNLADSKNYDLLLQFVKTIHLPQYLRPFIFVRRYGEHA